MDGWWMVSGSGSGSTRLGVMPDGSVGASVSFLRLSPPPSPLFFVGGGGEETGRYCLRVAALREGKGGTEVYKLLQV